MEKSIHCELVIVTNSSRLQLYTKVEHTFTILLLLHTRDHHHTFLIKIKTHSEVRIQMSQDHGYYKNIIIIIN